ncbi:MAG: metallophosphoesterase [Pirellulaceae bacterium]|nr:metallophosphoesterase [Pirellulaceae bacterium]
MNTPWFNHTLLLLFFVGFASVASAQKNGPKEESAEEQAFRVALLPDTQIYSLRYPEIYQLQTEWIAQEAQNKNIKFVIHLGDIINDRTEREWKLADAAMKTLEKKGIPYSVVPGNHDTIDKKNPKVRDTQKYNEYFSPERFLNKKWYLGNFEEGNENNVCEFTANGHSFLVVNLEYLPRDKAIAWADRVIKEHPNHNVIVATHTYLGLSGRDRVVPKKDQIQGNNGQQLWDKLIKRNANVFMVVNGHFYGSRFQQSKNLAGGKVIELLTDYQNLANGGNGWLRLLEFSPADKKIYVKTYSPYLQRVFESPEHTFEFDFDFGRLEKMRSRPSKTRPKTKANHKLK